MANLSQLGEILRQAVSMVDTATSTPGAATPIPPTPAVLAPARNPGELRQIFAPYRRNRGTYRPAVSTSLPKTTWTHKFCCLSTTDQEVVPDKSSKKVLADAGLGEKKLQVIKNGDADYLRSTLLNYYPRLKDGGGFDLLRSNARVGLEKVTVPANGYTSSYLADESGLGGAICYIRPIQQDLNIEPLDNVEPSDDCIKERCQRCGLNIPVSTLKQHIATCHENSDEDLPTIHKNKKQKRDIPICGFTCDW